MRPVRIKWPGRGFLANYLTGESMDHRQIAALFVPILIDQAFIIILNLFNTAMISSSGVAAISAVSMVDSLNMFLINVFVAVATGGTVIVAQYKGSGNEAMVAKASAGSVATVSLLALGLGLLLTAAHNPMLKLLFGAASEEVFANAKLYFIGSCASYLGIGIVQAVSGAMRGIGKTRVSLALSLIMNLTYVLLNVLFITVLDMGVLGLTVAMNIARYAAALCALYYVLRLDATMRLRLRELVIVPWSMLRKIMSIGLPFAAEQMFFNGGKMLTQVFIVSLGTGAIAANAIGNTLAMVYQIPAGALSLTIVTVVGQCMGRQDVADARKFIRAFVVLSSVSLLLMALILLPLTYPLMDLFQPPVEIRRELFWLIVINAIAQVPLWSISFILPAGLRAAGDARFTSITSMLSMWLFRVVLGYVFGITLGFGIIGVWAAMNCEWGVRGAIFLWRIRGKKWYAHRLIG
ncbi:MATE family efflux transporter [Paenibacillus cymbidii]|uniref:MATE family efflux transporter n=1 Tax=Paenibacillus cymbidii TaxID=1639034 RepID=UPI0038B27D9C